MCFRFINVVTDETRNSPGNPHLAIKDPQETALQIVNLSDGEHVKY